MIGMIRVPLPVEAKQHIVGVKVAARLKAFDGMKLDTLA